MQEIKIDPNASDPLAAALQGLADRDATKPRGRPCFTPGKGFTHNPLLGLPRNMACPCASGLKFKRCCLSDTQPYILLEALPEYKEAMATALAGEKAW